MTDKQCVALMATILMAHHPNVYDTFSSAVDDAKRVWANVR